MHGTCSVELLGPSTASINAVPYRVLAALRSPSDQKALSNMMHTLSRVVCSRTPIFSPRGEVSVVECHVLVGFIYGHATLCLY